MYRLTVTSPDHRTSGVISILEETKDANNVLVVEARESKQPTDMVTALVGRGSVDRVLLELRKLGDWNSGEIYFQEVDFAVQGTAGISTSKESEEEEALLGWEVILVHAREEARLTWYYLVFMACAGLIAAIGLISNIPLLLIGAMSLSPDLAPTNAIAVAISAGSWRDLWPPLRTLALGLLMAMVVAALGTFLIRDIHGGGLKITDEMRAFVTVVNYASVAIALIAGVAAMTAFVTNQATTAVGVAISVTTIPAAAYAGLAAASISVGNGSQALWVLFVNVFFLTLAQVVTLLFLRRRMKHRIATMGSGKKVSAAN